MRTSLLFPLALLPLALSLASAPAAAEGPIDPAKKAQAANFFDAGAEAYKAGKYQIAAEAFEKAHELLPSAALLFSAAQAYRRQYLTQPAADVLKRAIALYREYLRADANANRREDAMEALQTLVPLERVTVSPDGALGNGEGDKEPKAPSAPGLSPDAKQINTARLLVTAGAAGAEVSLDGGPFGPAPFVASVSPGPHKALVRAPGYDDQEVSLQGVANELVPQHVSLHPKPARLEVTGTSGARVSVDGQVRATVPGAAVSLDPGRHFVAVTLSGHEPLARRIEVERDQSLRLDAPLPTTRQRMFAWTALSAAGAGLVATGVLTGFTFARQSEALSLQSRPASQPLTPAERDVFNRDVSERNDFSQAATVAGIASAALLATGIGLFVLDEPEVVVPSDAAPAGKQGPKATFEVGMGMVGVRGVF
jgi:hypothetical protein